MFDVYLTYIRNVVMQLNKRNLVIIYVRLLFVSWVMSIRVKQKFLINCDVQMFKMVKLAELRSKLVQQMYQSMQLKNNVKLLEM